MDLKRPRELVVGSNSKVVGDFDILNLELNDDQSRKKEQLFVFHNNMVLFI